MTTRGPRRPGSRADPAGDGPTGFGGIDPDTGRPRKFAYPPQLVVVDGGPPQVAAAARALDELGIDDVALVGLAKRLEEVWLPGDDHPVVLPRIERGALPAAAGARRGAPVRDHVPPPAPVQDDDGERAGRRARARARPGARRCSGTSARSSGSGRRRPRRSPRCPASGRPPRRRSSTRWPATSRGTPAVNVTTGEILDDEPQTAAAGEEDRERRTRGRARTTTSPSDGPQRADRRPDPHRHVRRRPLDDRQRARGPRLVRRRQPAAADARADGRPGRAVPRRGAPGSPPWSTCAAGRSSPTCATA